MARVVAVWSGERSGALQRLSDDDRPEGAATTTTDMLSAVAEIEATEHPLWIWPDTVHCYPALVDAGVRVSRARDLAMTEAALEGYDGRWGAPRSLGAAWLRAHGGAPPEDEAESPLTGTDPVQHPLFAPTPRTTLPADVDVLTAAVFVHAEQRRRIMAVTPATAARRVVEPAPVTSARLDLLAATDSAAALVAVEMSRAGLPWRADIHDRLLTDALGPRPHRGERPPVLQLLAAEIGAALGVPDLNPDSHGAVLTALAGNGIEVESTRKWELRAVDHSAIEPLLRYKELSRLWTASGWAWRDAWVRDGRFRPEYVPAGVVSGRWATRGGGALQIPRSLRAAVVADEGAVLVVADAGQLEPRVLAALSQDPGMIRAAAVADLYAGLAAESFRGDRSLAKVGLLSAMYGGQSSALATLRQRYPRALALLEAAARAGEAGGLVRSVLGRTCPPPGPGAGLSDEQAVRRSRDRGRFTRNFLIQASAADWAGVLVAVLRRRLAGASSDSAGLDAGGPGTDGTGNGPVAGAVRPELVFFQHDEVIVHTPTTQQDYVVRLVTECAAEASRLVFGDRTVRIPLDAAVAADYASAKAP